MSPGSLDLFHTWQVYAPAAYRDPLGQNLVYWMDSEPGEPIEFLDAVMNLVKVPQPWDGMKHTMGSVETQI